MKRELFDQMWPFALSPEHPPGHRCQACRVLRVAFSGGGDEAYIREGFRKLEDGKWEDTEGKEGADGR
jgi:hypothetical protein